MIVKDQWHHALAYGSARGGVHEGKDCECFESSRSSARPTTLAGLRRARSIPRSHATSIPIPPAAGDLHAVLEASPAGSLCNGPHRGVTESNTDAITVRTGTVAPPNGGGFAVVGLAGAGLSAGHLGTPLQGTYGTLTIAADGSYTYLLDNNDNDTNLIGTGQVGSDRFTYSYQQNGQVHTGEIVIQISGIDEPGQVVTNYTSSVTVPGPFVVGALDRLVFTADQYINGLVNDLVATGVSALTNNGSIAVGTSTGMGGSGIYAGDGYLHPGGLVSADQQRPRRSPGRRVRIEYNGPHLGAASCRSVNNGVVQAHNVAGGAIGISANWQVVNNGLIEAISQTGGVTGVNDSGLENSGTIYASGASAFGVVGYGLFCDIDNSGTIHAVSTDPAIQSIGISLFPNSTNPYSSASIVNSGRIVADIAIRAVEGYNISLAVTNSGHIEGDLVRDQGLDVVVNAAGGELDRRFLPFRRDANLLLNAGSITGHVALCCGLRSVRRDGRRAHRRGRWRNRGRRADRRRRCRQRCSAARITMCCAAGPGPIT